MLIAGLVIFGLASALCGSAFVLIERRVRLPLVDLSLFRNAPYVLVTAAGAASNIAYTATIFASTLYLQQVKGCPRWSPVSSFSLRRSERLSRGRSQAAWAGSSGPPG